MLASNWAGVPINSKQEARNTKRFDQLTTLSQVEGQIRISNDPMFKTKSDFDIRILIIFIKSKNQ
jgi:hypothetical protein